MVQKNFTNKIKNQIILLFLFIVLLMTFEMLTKKLSLLDLTSQQTLAKVIVLVIFVGFYLALCFVLCVVVSLWTRFFGPLPCTPPKLMAFVLFNIYALLSFDWTVWGCWVLFLLGNVIIYFGANYPI